uniref:Ig-like domain-containing protein n=1 Tax=Sander lucioperca TaxID=283035 RepID=A0A8D0AJ16_SANLU
MMIRFVFCYLLTGFSLGVQVHQSPSAAIRKAGDDVQLVCTHRQPDYTVMLWYQQSPGDTALKLIGYVQYSSTSYEESYKGHFNITGDLSTSKGYLLIRTVNSSDSAVYFCAASTQ